MIRRIFAFHALALLCASLPAPAPAALKSAGYTKAEQATPPRRAFNKMDLVNARIGQMKADYFVGQPVVIPLVISNHTRFPITIRTNFNPRSQLSVKIFPPNKPSRPYRGPFQPGMYPPSDYFLYPMDEINTQVLVWADQDEPTGLAFPEPGEYVVKMELEIGILEGGNGGITAKITPPPVSLKIAAPPPELASVVEELKKNHVTANLHLKKTPDIWNEKVEDVIRRWPLSCFTPYLQYSAANYFLVQYNRNLEDKKAADKALIYLQLVAKGDSAFKEDAYWDLLKLMDKLELAVPAEQVAQQLLKSLPPDRLGQIGSIELVRKYLKNSAEIDPTRYWTLLP